MFAQLEAGGAARRWSAPAERHTRLTSSAVERATALEIGHKKSAPPTRHQLGERSSSGIQVFLSEKPCVFCPPACATECCSTPLCNKAGFVAIPLRNGADQFSAFRRWDAFSLFTLQVGCQVKEQCMDRTTGPSCPLCEKALPKL